MTKNEYRLALIKAIKWIADKKDSGNSCLGCALLPFKSFSAAGRCKGCARRALWLAAKELEEKG